VNIKQNYNTSFSDILFLVFFLPLYSSGPIASLDVLMERAELSVSLLIDSIFRIIVGLFKATFLSSVLLSDLIHNIQTFQTETSVSYFIFSYLTILLLFLKIYVSFSGISDIAIGLSRFFGFIVPENFDRPFLATSVQDFWKRWHITMSSTISELVFLRFVRKTGKANLGILVTFFAIGMWHEISLGYLIWSFMHAGGVMASRLVTFKFPFTKKGLDEPLYMINLKRILVWSYVSYASYQANNFDYGSFFQ
jgi:alginate O-acetyltransferase complex protein AlgI